MVVFFLSKLLPLLILPLGLSLLLLFSRIFFRWRWAVPSAFSLLWFFSLGVVSNGLTRLIESPWERQSALKAPQADAIVVLSGGRIFKRGKSQETEWNDPDRFFAGVKLFKAKKAPRLLFTGESRGGGSTSGELYIKEAIELGIPSRAMSTTSMVRNTADEAKKIRVMLDRQTSHLRQHQILLVTSASHMKRAKHVFESNGLKVFPFPADFNAKPGSFLDGFKWSNPYHWMPSATNLHHSSKALREVLARIAYRTW